MNAGTEIDMISAVEQALGSISFPFYFETELKTGTYFREKRKLGDESKIMMEMEKAHNYCDSVGFRRIRLGDVSLALIVFAEGLSRDEIIGRSLLVKNSVDAFGKFSVKTTWNKPVFTNIFYVFASSEKSFIFRNQVQDICKHTRIMLLRTIRVKPWCIDFQGKHVVGPKALLNGFDKEPSEIEGKLFGTV